jgi:hypothetical protein
MSSLSFADVRLNYDPSAPQQRFRDAGLEAAFLSVSAQLPTAPAWPEDAPRAVPLTPAPAETDDLTRFKGYDAVVVTWTAAEASALAALMTPSHPTSSWYEYRHGVKAYEPLVTGTMASVQRFVGRNATLLSQPGTLFSLRDWQRQGIAL